MLTHEEMIGLQAEKHELIDPKRFKTREEYVLHLVHTVAYEHAAREASNKRVLDLGCNTGYGTAILARKSKSIVGVDVSEGAVSAASREHANIEFHLVNGKELPFPSGSFDLVTSFQVIEHLVDPRQYLDEIRRVLVPGGVVLFTTPNAVLRLDPGMKPWNQFHVREFNADELVDLLQPFFSKVEISGLFADPELYEIERNRLTTARANARYRSGGAQAIAGALTKARRWLTRRSQPTPLDDNFTRRHGTESFYYTDSGLADALDLLATCMTAID